MKPARGRAVPTTSSMTAGTISQMSQTPPATRGSHRRSNANRSGVGRVPVVLVGRRQTATAAGTAVAHEMGCHDQRKDKHADKSKEEAVANKNGQVWAEFPQLLWGGGKMQLQQGQYRILRCASRVNAKTNNTNKPKEDATTKKEKSSRMPPPSEWVGWLLSAATARMAKTLDTRSHKETGKIQARATEAIYEISKSNITLSRNIYLAPWSFNAINICVFVIIATILLTSYIDPQEQQKVIVLSVLKL